MNFRWPVLAALMVALLSGCTDDNANGGRASYNAARSLAYNAPDEGLFLGMWAIEGDVPYEAMRADVAEWGDDSAMDEFEAFDFTNLTDDNLGDGRVRAWFAAFLIQEEGEDGRQGVMTYQTFSDGRERRSHFFDFNEESDLEAEEIRFSGAAAFLDGRSPVRSFMPTQQKALVSALSQGIETDECMPTVDLSKWNIDAVRAASIAMDEPLYANFTTLVTDEEYVYSYMPAYILPEGCLESWQQDEVDNETNVWYVQAQDIAEFFDDDTLFPGAAYVGISAATGDVLDVDVFGDQGFELVLEQDITISDPIIPVTAGRHEFPFTVTLEEGNLEVVAYLYGQPQLTTNWDLELQDPNGTIRPPSSTQGVGYEWYVPSQPGEWRIIYTYNSLQPLGTHYGQAFAYASTQMF